MKALVYHAPGKIYREE